MNFGRGIRMEKQRSLDLTHYTVSVPILVKDLPESVRIGGVEYYDAWDVREAHQIVAARQSFSNGTVDLTDADIRGIIGMNIGRGLIEALGDLRWETA